MLLFELFSDVLGDFMFVTFCFEVPFVFIVDQKPIDGGPLTLLGKELVNDFFVFFVFVEDGELASSGFVFVGKGFVDFFQSVWGLGGCDGVGFFSQLGFGVIVFQLGEFLLDLGDVAFSFFVVFSFVLAVLKDCFLFFAKIGFQGYFGIQISKRLVIDPASLQKLIDLSHDKLRKDKQFLLFLTLLPLLLNHSPFILLQEFPDHHLPNRLLVSQKKQFRFA